MSAKDRKYGRRHRQIRAALLLHGIGRPCVRCGAPIEAGQPVDLDHDDAGRGYSGLAHASCNRSAGGKRAALLKRARRSRIMHLSNVALGVEISRDRLHTSIAAAAQHGDRVEVGLIDYVPGTDTAAKVAEIAGRAVDLLTIVVNPASDTSTLVPQLKRLGLPVTEASAHDVAIAHGRFVDELRRGGLKIEEHPALDAAAEFALTRNAAAGEVLDRRRAPVDVGPLAAAQLAAWRIWYAPPSVLESVW